MKLTLDQNEIEQAIIAYARNCITLAEGTSITVDMTAGRGPNGFSATLDITPGVAQAKPVHVIVTQNPITKDMFCTPGERQAVAEIPKEMTKVIATEVAKVTGVSEAMLGAKPAKAAAKTTEAKANPFAKLPQADLEKQIQEDLEAADKAGNQEPQEPVEAPVEEPATEAPQATSIFSKGSPEAPAEEAPKLATSIFSKAAASGA